MSEAIDKVQETEVTSKPTSPFNNPKNPGNSSGAKDAIESLSFPREFSNIVYIRRKKIIGLPEEGGGGDDSKWKIGSSLKGTVVLRGLKPDEEEKWLAPLLSVVPKTNEYTERTKEYWINISKYVPTGEGLKLEIGFQYNNKEDYEHDKQALRDKEGVIFNPKGTPISINDYILWRYCLVYSKVANSPEDVTKSPKIDFYIFSKEREIKQEKANFDQRKEASQLMYSRLADRIWVDHILRLLIKGDTNSAHTVRDLTKIGDDEKDVLLEKYMTSNPLTFLDYGKDKNLETKSFIELAISLGLLTRIPNTNTISIDGNTIGNTIDEVVAFFRNPVNKSLVDKLQAQIRIVP